MKNNSKTSGGKSKKAGATKKAVFTGQVGNKKISFRVVSSSELNSTRNPAYNYLVK